VGASSGLHTKNYKRQRNKFTAVQEYLAKKNFFYGKPFKSSLKNYLLRGHMLKSLGPFKKSIDRTN